MDVSDEDRALARYVRFVFDGTCEVYTFHEDDGERSVDILIGKDSPVEGVSSYASLGVSKTNLGLTTGKRQLRVEILLAAGDQFEYAANIISAAALSIIKGQFQPQPERVMLDVVSLYYANVTMKHLLLMSPVSWDLETAYRDTTALAWLQGVPISDQELHFLKQNGMASLEALLEERDIDIFDLDRPSTA